MEKCVWSFDAAEKFKCAARGPRFWVDTAAGGIYR